VQRKLQLNKKTEKTNKVVFAYPIFIKVPFTLSEQKLLYTINFCRNQDWGKRVSEICLKNYTQILHRKTQSYKGKAVSIGHRLRNFLPENYQFCT